MATYILKNGKWSVEKEKTQIKNSASKSVPSTSKLAEWKAMDENIILKSKKSKKPSLLEKIGGTAARTLTSIGDGFLKTTENFADAGQYALANQLIKMGFKKAPAALMKNAKFDSTSVLTDKAKETYDKTAFKPFKTGGIVDTIASGVGQVGATVGASKLLGGTSTLNLGKLPIPTSSIIGGYGSGTTAGLNKGKSFNKSQAYGVGSGLIEGVSEGLSGGIGGVFGKGAVDDLLVNNLTNKVKSNLGKNLTRIGIKSIGEGLEENISGALNPYLQRLTIDQKAKLYNGDQALQDFVVGAATSALLQSPSINQKNDITPQNKANIQTIVQGDTNTPIAPQTNPQVAEIKPQEVMQPIKQTTSTNDILPVGVQSQINPIMVVKESRLQESMQKSPIVSQEFKGKVQDLTYNPITNQDTMNEAQQRLNKDLDNEVVRLFNIDPTKATSVDIAELIQLQSEYQRQGNIRSFQETVDRLRKIGTNAGQSVQAFAILQRMTPEGMVYYAQKDLQDIFDTVANNKSKNWVDKNKEKFNLTDAEINTILTKMKQVSETTNERQQKILLAQIQKLVNEKIPASLGNEIKSFRRISMLFNPKTQIRNIVGNTGVLPLNVASDFIGSQIEKGLSKKTGFKTIAPYQGKEYGKGFKKGVSEVTEDFKLGIDTNNINGNKFEIGRGNSFNNNTLVGKALNKVDRLNSTMLKLGDNPFFEAEFNNSLQNQLKLNKADVPTADMIDIATETALERTWQDNNKYTKVVLDIRNAMNKLNFKGFGLGDVIIPFAKTPANITKAMVDYSPLGLTKSLTLEAKQFKNAIGKGTLTPQMQRKFINNISKGISGSLVYLLAFSLKDMISGGADEDKDIRDFMKNTMGVNPYSIKIGDKSYTYDWAQPVSTPFSIVADSKSSDKEGFEKVIASLGTAGDRLIEQSFLQGISNLFSNFGSGKMENVVSTLIKDLPASFVPTVAKQVSDIVDKNARLVYSGDLNDTIKNSVIAKSPFLSKNLAKRYDTLGKEVIKYGGDNNLFNAFINPSNVNKTKNTEVGKEILDIYDKTEDKTIFPRVAPYSIKIGDENKKLTTKQQSEFQKVSGDIVNDNIKKLLKSKTYDSLSVEDKAEVLNRIVGYSYNKAKSEVFDIEISRNYKKAEQSISKRYSLADFYLYKIRNK